MKIKEFYIALFNKMEETIKRRVTLRMEYPLLTDNITLLHENPRPHHYSNEANMLNKIVTGMSAKEYKLKNGIPLEKSSIRPFLTDKERNNSISCNVSTQVCCFLSLIIKSGSKSLNGTT